MTPAETDELDSKCPFCHLPLMECVCEEPEDGDYIEGTCEDCGEVYSDCECACADDDEEESEEED